MPKLLNLGRTQGIAKPGRPYDSQIKAIYQRLAENNALSLESRISLLGALVYLVHMNIQDRFDRSKQ